MVSPSPSDVSYDPSHNTDLKKLAAMESLIGQAMAAARAESRGKVLTKQQQNELSTIMKRKLKILFEERNALRESIFRAAYPDLKVWNGLTEAEQHAAYLNMYGDKAAQQALPTLASSTALDELKAVDATKLDGTPFADPIEDFTTYTEVDPNSRITGTSDTISFVQLTNDDDSWVYKDMGAGHFDGDFEHLLKATFANSSSSLRIGRWGLANNIGAIASADMHTFQHFKTVGFSNWVLAERSGATNYVDSFSSSLTPIYVTIERDEAVGTNGTLYAYIYDAVTREPGDLQDTLSLTLHEKEDWRYIYGAQTNSSGSSSNKEDGTTEDLDLQEAVPEQRAATGVLDMLVDWVKVDGATYGSWYDIDLDGFSSRPADAQGALLLMDSSGGQYEQGVRSNGSSDDVRIFPATAATFIICKFDASGIIEHWAQNSSVSLYLAGWLRGRSVAFGQFDATDRKFSDDMTRDGSWETITATTYGVETGAQAVLVLFRAPGGQSSGRSGGIRAVNGVDTWAYGDVGDYQSGGVQICMLDGDQFECAIDATNPPDAWIIGYIKGPTVRMRRRGVKYTKGASGDFDEVVIAEVPAPKTNVATLWMNSRAGRMDIFHPDAGSTYELTPSIPYTFWASAVRGSDSKVVMHNDDDATRHIYLMATATTPEYPRPCGRIS